MLHEQQQNDGLFLSVKRGGLCLESKEEKEGYEFVEGEVDGKPYAKYVKKFSALDGRITKVEWYERAGDYGTFRGIKLRVTDGTEHYYLDLPFEKRPYDIFTKIAENIDYTEPVEIVAWPDKQNPGQTAFGVKQHDKFVPWRYTKDDMKDCPPAKQLRTGKWSFDEQREWLLERIIGTVIPHVDSLYQEAQYTGEEVAQAATVASAAVVTKHPEGCECQDCVIPF